MSQRPFIAEPLESRTLFAGVTIIANGRLGTLDGWVGTMANEITARLGGPAQVPQYVMTIEPDPNTGLLVPTVAQVAGTGTPQTSTSGEILLLVNYYDISANPSYSSQDIGSVIANYLLTTPVGGVALTSLPIHEVGLSRGAAVLDGVSLTLGEAGIWVDQQTYFDPDPIAAQGDPPLTVYDNVAFADDYWRNDNTGSASNNGQAVDGAYNLNVSWLDANSAGYITPHLAPAGYYNGTIDLLATQGGDGPIYPAWYDEAAGMPARDATGFIYTSIVGAARPASGVWAASGGTGDRAAAGQSGQQWGNVADLSIANGSTITAGDTLQVNFIREDRGGADTVTFYLDTDRNPFNDNNAATLGSESMVEADMVSNGSATLSTANVPAGKYFLCAQVTNSQGQTRYTYTAVTAPLTVVSPTGAGVQGSVIIQDNADAAAQGLLIGLRVMATEHLANGKVLRQNTTTAADGTFRFNGLVPGRRVVVQFFNPAGYTVAPHTHNTYSMKLLSGQVITTPVFSQIPIVPTAHRPKPKLQK
jgi:hypothetical protein